MPSRDRVLRLAERYAQLIKEAESLEHRRIQNLLASHANALGYADEVSFTSGLRPDVLRASGDYLFLADAKVADNETASRTESAERIELYVRAFASLLGAGKVRGGVIGIATNDEQEALRWAVLLDALCWKHDIVAADRSAANFQAIKLDDSTWFSRW